MDFSRKGAKALRGMRQRFAVIVDHALDALLEGFLPKIHQETER
jgi:hypothetical protein